MNKQKLKQQVNELKEKLAEIEAALAKPEVTINYWQPKKGDIFFYVDTWGNYIHSTAKDNITDRYRVFQTREEAKKYAEYIKAEEVIKAEIARLNEGWWPDWSNKNQIKCSIYLGDHLDWSSCYINKRQPNFMYLKSGTLAEYLIKTYSKELITYLSY